MGIALMPEVRGTAEWRSPRVEIGQAAFTMQRPLRPEWGRFV